MKLSQLACSFFIAAILLSSLSACVKSGCTNSAASNYDPKAKKDDGKCKINGCTDAAATNYNKDANTDDGSCKYTGKVIFWTDGTKPRISVNIGGQIGYIDSFTSAAPGCGTAGYATFTVSTGKVGYGASNAFQTWNDSVTITRDGCAQVLLTY